MPIDILIDAGPLPNISGAQWVVFDPVAGHLVVGTGFGGTVIADNADGFWAIRADANTGESLYVCLDPAKQDAQYQGLRRIDVAAESDGTSGYYDLAAKVWVPSVRSTSGRHRCGTSVGYLPGRMVIYGFVPCHSGDDRTLVMAQTLDGVREVGWVDGLTNGPWVYFEDALYNTVVTDGQVRGVRFDGSTFAIGGGPWPINRFGAHWSHDVFGSMFYYSEFGGRPGQNDSNAYAVDLRTGERHSVANGCQSYTFYTARDRSRIYLIGSLVENTHIVGVSVDGRAFTEIARLSHPGFGLAGSVATEDAEGRLIFANTGRILGGHPMLLRVIL